MNPKRCGVFVLGLWLAAGVASQAAAGTFEEGRRAYLEKDYARALGILEPLAKAGDAKAQVALGVMYYDGNGVAVNVRTAIEWYRKAAVQGVHEAQNDIGVIYYRGVDVRQDYAEALKWWRLAADAGYADSQFYLGILYSRGQGVPQSDPDALNWYRKAADQGHKQALYSLAVMYAFGKGVPTDYAKAASLFRRSAELGMPQAQYNLAVLLENGQGVDKDPTAARQWYEKAAAAGLGSARRRIAALGDGSGHPPIPEADSAPAAATMARLPGETAGFHQIDWVRAQDASAYTLQIAAGTDERALVSLLNRAQLRGDIAYFAARVDGQPRFTAVYGVYRTYSEAKGAIATLPAGLQKGNPWVRKFATVQALLAPAQ